MDERYGQHSISFRRICDHAGALRQQDRVKLNAILERLEKKIPPVMLAVYFPNIREPFGLVQHNFWLMNHIQADEAGFPNRKDPVNPQWLLILVIDVRTDNACFMWGYQLDPYLQGDYLNSAIRKAKIPLRESLLVQATATIMKHATSLVARAARLKIKSKHTQGLLPDLPAQTNKAEQ